MQGLDVVTSYCRISGRSTLVENQELFAMELSRVSRYVMSQEVAEKRRHPFMVFSTCTVMYFGGRRTTYLV